MHKVIDLNPDCLKIVDKLDRDIVSARVSAGPKKTLITITDADTGEVLGEYHNKVLVAGSMFTAVEAFGVDVPVILPTYNEELGLDETLDYTDTDPLNEPIVCLFCVGDSGCGSQPTEVYVTKYTDRIEPKQGDIIPFRYVDKADDLNSDLRKYYFGRKDDGTKISYYFKKFDTDPQLHLRYVDGTQITENLYNTVSDQAIECYVETRLRITRLDFRDYFEQVLGWDNARISTLSLCYAWYTEKNGYKYYQQISPYTKLNFTYEWLVDLTKSIDFNYKVYY